MQGKRLAERVCMSSCCTRLFVPRLSQPACLGIYWILPVIIMRLALEHCLLKHLSYFDTNIQTWHPNNLACVLGKYACMMKAWAFWVIVSIKSTAVFGELCISLDELTSHCLPFMKQQLQQQEDSKVSSFCLFLCSSWLLWASVQPEWLGVSWVFAVVIKRPLLAHGLSKDLSGFVMFFVMNT
jgi:hypothetical protein